ncbi:phage/plasmid primase, P4 family [Methylobacterium organophilum]|jgi:putative DNA primase/helicase|uniref:phage/plasmid primase, P4 family n=1 Tax=Methylobacterium organophilum TaxID=410 RepID=UPI001FEF7926|nr:phage/plasmid primase, P4 family [Methylobacterium organophilum]
MREPAYDVMRGALAAVQPSVAAKGQPEPKPRRKRRSAPPADDLITEDSAALRFAAQYEGQLLFCHDTGAWFVWSGAAWERNWTGLANHWARELARKMASGEPDKVRAVAGRSGFAGGVEAMSRRDPIFARRADIWDADPWLLGTPGGTVDLRTGSMRRADPAENITRLTAVAPDPHMACPTWLRFLDEATRGDTEYIRFLRQWGGYCLTGDTSEQALCFAHGGGGNGKGVFVRTLSGIMKDYALSAAMETFTASRHDRHPTEIASLRGARLVTASETQGGRSWNAQRIKQLTGGDVMRARHMRQDEFEFIPVLKLLFMGNSKPGLASVGKAERRRFNLLPFEFEPASPDPHLEDRLRAEWPAILHWLILGCLDWKRNGLIRPKTVLTATEDYFSDQDVFAQWLEDECEVAPANPDLFTSKATLFAAWTAYATKAGERVGDTAQLGEALQRHGIQPKRTNTSRGFTGIRLRPSYPDSSTDLR